MDGLSEHKYATERVTFLVVNRDGWRLNVLVKVI